MEPSEAVGGRPRPTATMAWVWLAAAAALLLFANGRHTVAAAAWLAPVFLLRFVRLQRPGRGLALAAFVLSATWAFQFRGMAPLPLPWFLVLAVVYGLVGVLPFVVDRVLAPRVGGFAATLVLPCAWAATEYLVANFTPYGSWGSVAYTQHESLILFQLVSITGLYGLSFLIAWFASVCNWGWERHFSWPEIRRGTLVYLAVVLAVSLFGGARLVLAPSLAPTVRVASLSKSDVELFSSADVAGRAYAGTLSADETEQVKRRGREINDDLLARSRREAQAGARIVFWGETNAFVFKEDEPELLDRCAELARAQQIYLGVAVGTWNPQSPKPLENRLVLIGPRGETVWQTLKAIPIPGGEAAISARDDGRIKSATTPHGRVGGAICFDMDFPGLLKQAGQANADIMLVPSNDWREIDPWHSHMARFRAVEQGFNLVRHTSKGLSLAADYQGRVLNSMDHYTATDRVLVSHVPTRGVATVYSRIGDTFAWLCIAGLAVLTAMSRRRSARARRA